MKEIAVIVLLAIMALATATLLAHRGRIYQQRQDDNVRRTNLCESRGGIPRYQVRGRDYAGCDFPTR